MNLTELLGAFGVITSVLSFCDNAALASVCSYAMYAFWGACVVLIVLKRNVRFRPIMLYMLIGYAIMFAAGRFFFSLGFYQSRGPGPAMYLPYCAFFYFVGYNSQSNCKREISIYVKAYLYAHVVFVLLKLLFLRQAENAGLSKNQSSQIIGLGIVLALYVLPQLEGKKWYKWFFAAFALLSFLILFQMHSRTPALAVLLTTAYWFLSRKPKMWHYVVALLLLAASVYYFTTENGSDFLFEYLRGDNRGDELTWSVVTSGRTDQYGEVFREILQHPLIGQGAWQYLDSFPLHVVRTGGLLAAAIVIPVAYGRCILYIKTHFRASRKQEAWQQDSIIRVAAFMSFYFFVVSMFEGYPPLGPAASTFILWLTIGIADRHRLEELDSETLRKDE